MNLGGIGSLASGLSQGLQPYFQQQMQNVGASDLGAALMSQYGVNPSGQAGGQEARGGGIGSLSVSFLQPSRCKRRNQLEQLSSLPKPLPNCRPRLPLPCR